MTVSLKKKALWGQTVAASSVPHGLLPFQCVVGSGGRTRVDVELVFILEGLKLVRVPRDEDVHVQLSLEQSQAGHVAPRDHLVAVDQADLELAHRDHLLLWVVEVLREEGKRDFSAFLSPNRTTKTRSVICICRLNQVKTFNGDKDKCVSHTSYDLPTFWNQNRSDPGIRSL